MNIVKLLILGFILLFSFALNASNRTKEVSQQVDLFDVCTKKIERGRFVNNLDNNIESYLEQTGWGNKKKKAFWNAYLDFREAILKKCINKRDARKQYIDECGKLGNSKNEKFDAYGAFAHYMDIIVDAMPAYAE
jgi:hypothetical protein